MSEVGGATDATVVICTRDRPTLVVDAARSVAAGDVVPEEIIVVDLGAPPCPSGTFHDVPGVRHLPVGPISVSAARNTGAAEARTSVIAFIDDDERVTAGWLGALLAGLGDGPRTVVTGRVVAGEPETPDAMIPATVLGETPAVFRGRLDGDVLAGGNMAIRRSALAAVGGWDEALGPGTRNPAAEDNDLGLRLLEAGQEIAYVPDALVVHRAWRPARRYTGTRWRYGLGKGGFYAKHARLDGSYGLRRGLRDVGRRLARAPVVVWRHPRYAAGELSYAAGVVVGAARWGRQAP